MFAALVEAGGDAQHLIFRIAFDRHEIVELRLAQRERAGLVHHQRIDFAQFLDDVRVRLPDELAAEEFQARHIHAASLHRIENFIKAASIGAPDDEVVRAVSW